MKGTKFYKSSFNKEEYKKAADYCNSVGNLTIEDKGDYYEVCEIIVSQTELNKAAIETYKSYLNDTDWIVSKCSELGLNVSEVYPEEYKKRLEARSKINELEELIKEANNG